MGARELEWHKAAAGGSVLKARFYLGPAAPGAKLLAVVVLLAAAAAVIYLLRRHLREMWVGLRKRRPVAITTATFFVVLLFSRIVDKSFRGSLDPSIIASRQIVEEMLELLLPLLVVLGVFQRSHARDSRETAAALRRARPVPAPARVESVAGSGLHLPLSKTGLSDRQG
jgi:hypothetical protein